MALPVDNMKDILSLLSSVDKPMFQSKKFTGFLLIQITWKALIAYGLYIGLDTSVLMSMVGAAAATETAFMGAQAWHDTSVKTAKMSALNGSVMSSLSDRSSQTEE